MDLTNIKEQWENTPGWQKALLLITLTGGVLYLIFTILISPKYDEYKALNEEVQNIENEIELLKSSVNPQIQLVLEKKLQQVKTDLKNIENKLEVTKKIIPPKPNLDDILSVVSLSAKKSMLTLNSFKVEKEEDVTLYYNKNTDRLEVFNPTPNKDKKEEQKIPENAIKLKKINITVNVSGNFNSIKNFLDEIVKSERFISTENVSIKKEGGLLNGVVKLAVYYLPE
ncbi:type 4a pilus biogenesis protein PilO [Sulfurihydrogenibium sp.]|jgi:Tfp pilus assembly protein PilO|uniref:type 4a pilus biogenesis protein PilO n=1 Tax=Sulfurihydrogenibium sp. TaxID=2053621 RepID=UPI002610A808|nr:type 4a pilus biogenesis protein PilO [Sulfurihydrogenibium sp.]